MKQFNQMEKFIHKSLLDLMDVHPFSAITVTMIAKHAEINRKTFYSYYSSKEDLFKVMVEELFTELFSCFMYEKEEPEYQLDVPVLEKDIRRFLILVEQVRPVIEILITEETSALALETANQVILHLSEKVHIKESVPGLIPKRFYVEVIRNFFMGMIDCLYEEEIESLDEGVEIMKRIMSLNQLNAFRYMRKNKIEKTV